MKKIYIIIILIVLVTGIWFFWGMGKKAQAPTSETETSTLTPPTSTGVACTMDAKMCPDGSYVGRIGPSCEFAACPSVGGVQTFKEFIVTGKNFSFSPPLITVAKGDRVKITFQNTEGFHNFKIDEFGVATKQSASPTTEVLEFTADKVGSFEYYCSVGSHRSLGMKGILKVE